MRNFIYSIISATALFPALLFGQATGECPDIEDKRALKTYQKAHDLFTSRKFTESVPLFKEVIEIDPEAGQAYFYLGYYNFKFARNYAAAEKYLLKSIEFCPDFDIYAYYFLGEIAYGNEDWAKAKEYFTQFLKDPALIDDDGYFNSAREYLKWSSFYNAMYNKPVPFDPKHIPGICTPNHEYLPSFSPDGEIAFYTRTFELPPRKGDLIQKKVFKESLFSSTKQQDQFGEGSEMPYPFNITDNIGGVSITIDNRELYVAVGKFRMDGALNVDICYSHKDDNGNWSDLDTVRGINSPKTWDTQPSISSDGNTLYFISDRLGGFGGGDIWCVQKNDSGEWNTPVNLGPVINTRGEEKTPVIHTDNQTLYFSSNGHESLAKPDGDPSLDIFYARKKEDGTWSAPKNIGYPINTEEDESGFIVSTDGTTGYFASNKFNGPGGYDIYSFELHKDARPQDVLFVRGQVTQEENHEPVSARVEIKNVVTRKITEIPVDSLTGKFVFAVPFKNDYIMTVKKEDYAYESKYFAVEDSIFNEPANVEVEIKPVEVGKSYRLNDIYFATNSYELNNESRTVLEGFFEFLNENPKIRVSIEGHTDDIGNDDDNLRLSDDRAKAVFEYLVQNQIDAVRLSFKGFGETKPIATNASPEGRAKNRRTEFVITEK